MLLQLEIFDSLNNCSLGIRSIYIFPSLIKCIVSHPSTFPLSFTSESIFSIYFCIYFLLQMYFQCSLCQLCFEPIQTIKKHLTHRVRTGDFIPEHLAYARRLCTYLIVVYRIYILLIYACNITYLSLNIDYMPIKHRP